MKRTAALVLAGGMNLGFSVLTHNRAKSALPVCGHYRIIDFPLTNLAYSGVTDVGILIQYLPGSLIDHIGIGRAWDFDTANRHIKLMPPFVGMGKTRWFRGTADAIYQNLNYIADCGADELLVISADHVYSMDYGPLVAYHRYHNADLTIVSAKLPEGVSPKSFGYVEADNRGRVTRFVEKPDRPLNDRISTGIYLFNSRVLRDRLEALQDTASSHHLPSAVVEPLVDDGRVYAFEFDGDWEYLPDLESYVSLHHRILMGGADAPQFRQVLTNMRDRQLGSRPSPFFGRLANVDQSIISPGCVIEGTVSRSVLSPGVRVEPRAVVRDSILLHDCRVEEGAVLDGVVSDKDAVYHAHCRVGLEGLNMERPSMRELTVVGKGGRIMHGMRIEPGEVIPIDQVVNSEWIEQRRQTVSTVA